MNLFQKIAVDFVGPGKTRHQVTALKRLNEKCHRLRTLLSQLTYPHPDARVYA